MTINLQFKNTFDGPEYLSVSDSISSPLLSSDLEQLCVNIVKHVQEVSGGNIQIIRMVLYFKVDQENRIWLMFCTGIKVKDKFSPHPEKHRSDSPLFKIIRRDLEPVITGTENVQKVVKYNSEGQIEELLYQIENVCSNCDLFSSELYQLQFEQIIESFERVCITCLLNSILKILVFFLYFILKENIMIIQLLLNYYISF